MMYDLSRPIFNNAPQCPKFPSTSMAVQHLTATESANVERFKLLLVARKLLMKDIPIPEAMLDGRVRHFHASPELIQDAAEAWTRAVAWNEGEMA
jgi:hypothetical protein